MLQSPATQETDVIIIGAVLPVQGLHATAHGVAYAAFYWNVTILRREQPVVTMAYCTAVRVMR